LFGRLPRGVVWPEGRVYFEVGLMKKLYAEYACSLPFAFFVLGFLAFIFCLKSVMLVSVVPSVLWCAAIIAGVVSIYLLRKTKTPSRNLQIAFQCGVILLSFLATVYVVLQPYLTQLVYRLNTR
jgi:hypothetical protein